MNDFDKWDKWFLIILPIVMVILLGVFLTIVGLQLDEIAKVQRELQQ